jgi:hypothetical protein
MYYLVTEVTSQDNYLLRLKFKNGEEKIFNIKPYLNTGIFKELKDESMFKTAKVSFDTVEWANEADIDPETLYHESVALQKA